jgi:hypothetical protein
MPRWMVALMHIGPLSGFGFAAWSTLSAVPVLAVGLLILAVGFAFIMRWFTTMDLVVTSTVVEARFGQICKRFRPATIESVQAEGYHWQSYGGWGIRRGFGGRRAYTVPFLRSGVLLSLHDGHRWYLSSSTPEALEHAIQEAIESTHVS